MEVGKTYLTGVIDGKERKFKLLKNNNIVRSNSPADGKISLRVKPVADIPK